MGFGLLKRRKGEVSCDGWKVVKKFFQGVSAPNVIRLAILLNVNTDSART